MIQVPFISEIICAYHSPPLTPRKFLFELHGLMTSLKTQGREDT
uniref:Uncharacterized protein n=1 Tax=Rhizophora mucronata TaxID=61149 RepID=A0A2P2QPP2_RHIMU